MAHQQIRLQDLECRQEEQEHDTIGVLSQLTIHIIYGDTTAHRVAHENPVQRMVEQQWDLLHHREARSDPEYQVHEREVNIMRRQQVRT